MNMNRLRGLMRVYTKSWYLSRSQVDSIFYFGVLGTDSGVYLTVPTRGIDEVFGAD